MSEMDSRAREYWRTATLLRSSAINSMTRRLALGRVLDNQAGPQVSFMRKRFAALAAEHVGELQAFDPVGRRTS